MLPSKLILALTVAIFSFRLLGQSVAGRLELNTALFESTFKIEQRINATKSIVGTGFILGRPMLKELGRAKYVLVTANHVLEGMKSDEVQLSIRRLQSNGTWNREVMVLKIRSNGVPLWKKHPSGDVAVMSVGLPDDVIRRGMLLPTTLLADDQVLRHLEIHPGDELNCLGYPNGMEANDIGFPILRSGKIASYPLLPTKEVRAFLFDFEVFGGNSGGPVYLVHSNRVYQGGTNIGVVQSIVGLVSQQFHANGERLAIARVVHASLIKEALELLPSPDE